MSTSNLRLILDALDEYAKQTGMDLNKNPFAEKLQSCDSPDAIVDLLQTKAMAFKEYREGNRELINWLGPTVHVLHALSGTLGEVANLAPFQPTKAIFVGIDFLLTIAGEVSLSYDALIDLFECMGNFLRRLNVYTEIPFTAAMTDIIVKILVELLSVLSLATKQIKQGRFKKFAKKLLGESEIEAVLQRLDRLTGEEARMTAAQTLQVVHGLMNNIRVVMDDGRASADGIRQVLVNMQQTTNRINKMERDHLQKDVRNWLSPPDPSTNHNIAREAYQSGTARWFFQGNVFSEWKATGSLLWIHGKPGSGKSILLSAIIQDILGIRAAGLASMAYYYFDFRDAQKQHRYGLLSSLLFQLCAQSDTCSEFLSRLYITHDSGTQKPTDGALTQCLKDMLELPGQPEVYLIIDALDECPNTSGMPTAREKVLEIVEELIDLQLPNLRICVSSRPEIDIRNVLEPLASLQLSLHDESGQKKDILDYVRTIVHSDRRMRRWRTEDHQLVIDTLSEKADGMFRWVFCQLEILRRSFPASIRNALDDLPKTLDETYEHTLLGIDEEKREYAHRLFQCLTVSIRPLLVEELAEVLAIRFDSGAHPKFNANWRPGDAEEAVLSACSSLVAVVNVHGFQVVQFSHFSVKEFLTSSRLSTSAENLSRYHVLLESAHAMFAGACLSVLLKLDAHVDRKSIEEFPLAVYAAQHWVDHGKFGNVSSRIQDAMVLLFDSDGPHFSVWVWLHDVDHPWIEHTLEAPSARHKVPPLYYAVICGFQGLVEHLIATYPRDVNAQGGYHVTPLHAAVAKGHIDIARLLLKNGADVNAMGNEDLNLLQKASRSGNLDTMKLLLEHDADVNARNGDGLTPLDMASADGELEATRLLLKHGADVATSDNDGWTPLHSASRYGHLEVVRLLLDHGADVNKYKNDHWTPLHMAAGIKNFEISSLLVEHGADVNLTNLKKETPLDLASGNGGFEVVRLLIEHGADTNSSDESGWTPLHTASSSGRLDIVQLLLDHGTDVNVRNKSNETPLDIASGNGMLKVASLLVKSGADVNCRDNNGWTPLHTASHNGHFDVAQLLLQCGADVHTQNGTSTTSLSLASENGKLEVSRLLIERGADVDYSNDNSWTPLHRASRNGHLEIVRLLLDHGSDVNAQKGDLWTPLHLASANGYLEVTRLLIERGADVNMRNQDQKTPLDTTPKNGGSDIARLLIEHGANANPEDNVAGTLSTDEPQDLLSEVVESPPNRGEDHDAENDDQTSLHTASREGNLSIVKSLLDRGADVNARNESHETPLGVASSKGNLDVARLLIEHGADLNARDRSGWSPLHETSRNGHTQVARLLLDNGADVNAKEQDQWTPLHFAARNGHIEILELLLEYGAIVHLRNDEGRTASQAALARGHREIAQLLSRYVEARGE